MGKSVPACLCAHSTDTHSEREEARLGSVPVRKLSERSLQKLGERKRHTREGWADAQSTQCRGEVPN